MRLLNAVLSISLFGLSTLLAQESLESILAPLPRVVSAKTEEKLGSTLSAPTPSIEPVTCTINLESFSHQVQLLLKNYYKLNGETVKVFPVQGWHEISIPESSWNLEIIDYPADGLSPKISLQYRVVGANGSYGPYRVLLSCELWRDAYVAKQSLSTKLTLDRSHFSADRVDVLRLPSGIVDSNINFSEYELVQSMSSGKVLLWRHLKKRPTVLKGSLVDVVAKEGYMQISMKGEALRDGFVGEFIPVKNPNTRKDFKAEIVSENTVRLHF